ncbi:MAG: CMP/dCMP deaminase zinc-binding protein dCMP deaminase [Candidatus Parcubacteria bacterium]|nr:CMP/dCMP deaminase zinc-binding protein dCMP deaminase [Candidatus Parcubacteria bacterium]
MITDPTYKRPSWDEYFMNIAELVGSRATCSRGRSGCVVVKDKRILVTGYVGSPMGLPHCDEVGHEMHKVIHEDGSISEHCIRTAHAEQNAIAHAAKLGISLDGATVYCHMTPCYVCAKILINSGIKKVVALKDYHASRRSKEVFEQAGVKLQILNAEVESYTKDRFTEKKAAALIPVKTPTPKKKLANTKRK